MEQKRTIWIVLAAGIFLLVVLGAALILYAPEAKHNTTALYQRDAGTIWMSPDAVEAKKNDLYSQNVEITKPAEPQQIAAVIPESAGTDSISLDDINTSSVITDIDTPKEGTTRISDPVIAENMTVISTGTTKVYGNASEDATTIDVSTIKTYEPVSNVRAQNKVAEEKIRETNSVRHIEKKEPYVERKHPAPAPVETVRFNREPPAPPAPKAAPAKVQPAPAAKKVSAPVKSPEIVPDRFWVQAGSYTTKKHADEARGILEAGKIQCEVFTYTDPKDNLYFRVRVGPYTTKSEAEYWKRKIDQISYFAKNNSYVTKTK